MTGSTVVLLYYVYTYMICIPTLKLGIIITVDIAPEGRSTSDHRWTA